MLTKSFCKVLNPLASTCSILKTCLDVFTALLKEYFSDISIHGHWNSLKICFVFFFFFVNIALWARQMLLQQSRLYCFEQFVERFTYDVLKFVKEGFLEIHNKRSRFT